MKTNLFWKILTVTFCLIVAVILFQRFAPKPKTNPTAVPTSGGEAFSTKIETPVFYLQKDPKWGSDSLANTNQSLAGYGCTVCATTMALTAHQEAFTPAELNQKLTENNGFTESGLLIWKGIETVSAKRFSLKVPKQPTHALIDAELKRVEIPLKQGNPVIAKVWYNQAIWHWVLITGKDGKDYLMHDPLGSPKGFEKMKNYPTGIHAIRFLLKN